MVPRMGVRGPRALRHRGQSDWSVRIMGGAEAKTYFCPFFTPAKQYLAFTTSATNWYFWKSGRRARIFCMLGPTLFVSASVMPMACFSMAFCWASSGIYHLLVFGIIRPWSSPGGGHNGCSAVHRQM